MDSTDAGTPSHSSHSLDAARAVPIAELCPDLPDPTTTAVGGIVTITWPYNKVKGTFAFSLAEPDFRLRRNKGQVRIDFTGRAAKAVGDCGLGSNDEVRLSLAGASWETEVANKRRSLPGADLGWRLIFSETLLLEIKRAETSNTDLIVVNEQPTRDEASPDPTPAQLPSMTDSPSPPPRLSPIHITSPVRETSRKRSNDNEFASPAFIKRARMSYGSLFEDGFDIFQDDSGGEGKGRKRTRFGRDSSAWRYTSKSPSPEPATTSPKETDEQVVSSIGVGNSPARGEMTDEGCQTMELDRSSPQPAIAPLETNADMMVPQHLVVPVNDAPSDAYTQPVIERTRSPPPNNPPPETGAENEPTPNFSQVPDSKVDASLPHPGQQVSQQISFTDSPWNVETVPSTLERQQKEPFPPLHVDESFASSSFGDIMLDNQPIPFGECDGLNEPQLGDGENQESINDAIVPSTELDPPVFDYPPFGPIEDTHPEPIHDEALTNYPTSYLEGSRTSLPNQMTEERPSQKLPIVELGTSSWATVNQNPNVTTVPQTDRVASRDGTTPEQALVIDESDSDSDSEPEPMAVEDTLNDARTYPLDMYEDAEVEDEADAPYSDDDEPEYDSNEMGGDYDTRNYQQPDDDDDGGYDEEIRPHHLDPEFDEGESWDEEQQEEFLDEEDEGEYKLDEEVPEPDPQPSLQPDPQPVTRANPTVIDLISSSEDESEGEDEDEDENEDDSRSEIRGPDSHIDPAISPVHRKTISEDDSRQAQMDDDLDEDLDDDDSEIISQAPMSEADNSSYASGDDHEYASSYQAEEGEDGDDDDNSNNNNKDDEDREGQEEGIGQDIGSEAYEPEGVHTSERSEDQAEQLMEQEINLRRETELENDAILGGRYDGEHTLSQETIPRTGLFGNAAIANRKENPEEGSAIVSFSAPDGLEMLSRAVDNESSAHSHRPFAESVVEKVVMETISDDHPPAETFEEDDVRVQDLLDNQLNAALERVLEEVSLRDNREDQVDQIAASKLDTKHLSSMIGSTEPTTTTPSSPPLTQSFQSHIEEDVGSVFEEATITSTAQIATTQLPTPLDTQVTDTALNTSTSIHMITAESFDSYTTIEQQDFKNTGGSVIEESIDNPAHQGANMDKNSAKQDHGNTLTMELEARIPADELSSASSPAASFQTQVGNEELAWLESEEQTKIDSQLAGRLSPDHGSNESDASNSFASHIDIDDELQASILETSLLEEHNNYDGHDSVEEPNQYDTNETSFESESTGDAETGLSLLHENTPAKQLAEEISAQLRRNFVANSSSSGEDSDTSMLNDPSVHLARVANASKRRKRKRASSGHLYRPRRRTLDVRRSPTPETDASSIRLARASLSSQTPKSEEDSPSMTAAKLQLARHLRDSLPDFCALEALRQHVTKSLDIIAVAAMQPPDPRRAKGGPREYMMSFTISDYSIGPYNVAEAFLYRPHKESLPVIRYGDVVLFRNFTVVSLAGKGFGLRSNDQSSWAVFDYDDEPAQIRGPPVEYIQREIAYVNYLREWFSLLDGKARARLECATQDFINAGKFK